MNGDPFGEQWSALTSTRPWPPQLAASFNYSRSTAVMHNPRALAQIVQNSFVDSALTNFFAHSDAAIARVRRD
jgi:hypothetical protein